MRLRIQQVLIVAFAILVQACSKDGTPTPEKPTPTPQVNPSNSLDIQQKEVESVSGSFKVTSLQILHGVLMYLPIGSVFRQQKEMEILR